MEAQVYSVFITHGRKSSGKSIRGLKLKASLKNGHFHKGCVGCVIVEDEDLNNKP